MFYLKIHFCDELVSQCDLDEKVNFFDNIEIFICWLWVQSSKFSMELIHRFSSFVEQKKNNLFS